MPRDGDEIIYKKFFFLKNVDHLDQSPINGVPTPFVMIQPFGSAWINMDQEAGTFSIRAPQREKNRTRQFVSPQVWIIWINAHKALIQRVFFPLIQMIHTCGEINCPLNP